MFKENIDLINDVANKNDEFRRLFEDHIRYEQDLEALMSLRYFPPEVESRIREIKKSKLHGKDRMIQLINEYKNDN